MIPREVNWRTRGTLSWGVWPPGGGWAPVVMRRAAGAGPGCSQPSLICGRGQGTRLWLEGCRVYSPFLGLSLRRAAFASVRTGCGGLSPPGQGVDELGTVV